jgi:hypothetical protein
MQPLVRRSSVQQTRKRNFNESGRFMSYLEEVNKIKEQWEVITLPLVYLLHLRN